ncbi:MAG: substrate-binding domain-containing protein [Thermodesulfobacteriota bacterium]
MTRMNTFCHLLSALLIVFTAAFPAFGGDRVLKMSTTTSTQASGLLDILLPEFTKETGIRVKVIVKGTGAAIRDGMEGNVDIIFVHARQREEKFLADGYGTKRFAVMHNDFILLGPGSDPAGAAGEESVARAMKRINDSRSGFVSRGDDSGTHIKEQQIWLEAGVTLSATEQLVVKKGVKKAIRYQKPQNSESWYISIGQGMGKTITYADEKQLYTLSDRGTYIKYRYGRTPAIDLEVVREDDPVLMNPYGVIPVSPEKHPHVNHDAALRFAHWVTSAKGQRLIGDYRLMGRRLFYPDTIPR